MPPPPRSALLSTPRKIQAANGGTTTASAVVHNTGCGCSKSACLKRYCECFNGGIACSDKCRCKDCKNTVADVDARMASSSGKRGGSGNRNGETIAAVLAAANAGAGCVTGGGRCSTATAAPVGGISGGAQAGSSRTSRKGGAEAPGGRGARAAAGPVASEMVEDKIDIGGVGGGEGAVRHGPSGGGVRSPLGLLPGFAMGDEYCSNNRVGSTRV